MKKICVISVILAFLSIVLSSYTETDDFFRYEYAFDGSVVIVGYEGFEKSLRIPDQIDGHPVTAIGESAFYANKYVERLTIPKNIAVIEKDAFAYMEKLYRVTVEGGGSLVIGQSAFEGCNILEKVELGEGVLTIGDRAMQYCTNLRSVTLPSSIKEIGWESFGGCDSLILHTERSDVGKQYAIENHIDTSFTEGSGAMWLKIGGGVLIGCLAVLAVYWILSRKKKNKSCNLQNNGL